MNSTPFLSILVMIAGVTTLLARSGLLRGRDRPLGLMTLFIAMGFVVTTWRFWVDAFRSTLTTPILSSLPSWSSCMPDFCHLCGRGS